MHVAAQLAKAGFDVVAASSQAHTRNITDEELLAVATADDRVIVTENIAEFTALAARWAADGRTCPGIALTSSALAAPMVPAATLELMTSAS